MLMIPFPTLERTQRRASREWLHRAFCAMIVILLLLVVTMMLPMGFERENLHKQVVCFLLGYIITSSCTMSIMGGFVELLVASGFAGSRARVPASILLCSRPAMMPPSFPDSALKN